MAIAVANKGKGSVARVAPYLPTQEESHSG